MPSLVRGVGRFGSLVLVVLFFCAKDGNPCSTVRTAIFAPDRYSRPLAAKPSLCSTIINNYVHRQTTLVSLSTTLYACAAAMHAAFFRRMLGTEDSIEDKIIPTLEWLQMELRASPEEVRYYIPGIMCFVVVRAFSILKTSETPRRPSCVQFEPAKTYFRDSFFVARRGREVHFPRQPAASAVDPIFEGMRYPATPEENPAIFLPYSHVRDMK